MTGNQADVLIALDALRDGGRSATFKGAEHGASVSFIFVDNLPGEGPRLHRHPYDETFVMLEGSARFTVGEQTVVAAAGQILVAPAGAPHKFVALEPGPVRSVNIHAAPQMQTEWLE